MPVYMSQAFSILISLLIICLGILRQIVICPKIHLQVLFQTVVPIIAMYTLHPDDILNARGANPRTGRISPFPVADDKSECQCWCHYSLPQRHCGTSNADTHSSESTNPQSASYDDPLNQVLPPLKNLAHPSKYSTFRPTRRRSDLRRFLSRFRIRRRASKPLGEGAWLHAALHCEEERVIHDHAEQISGFRLGPAVPLRRWYH